MTLWKLRAHLTKRCSLGSSATLVLAALMALDPASGRAAAVINAGGIVNAASYGLPGSFGASAGSIASIFGTGLATSTLTATTLPLPLTLGTTSVRVQGIPAPLFYVSPTQINFQLPWQPCCSDLVRPVIVTVNNVESNDFILTVSAFGPAIFSADSTGSGQGTILIANTSIFAAPSGSIAGVQARPAQRGELISIFCTGLGPVTNRPAEGVPAQANPTSETLNPPTVTIGGIVASVDFAGLAPGFVGLYQVNVRVPSGASTGSAVPVRISLDVAGGVPAPPVTMAIQ